MSKNKKIILVVLGLIIILLIIGLVIVNNKPKKKILTTSKFISNYEEVNKNNKKVMPLKNHVIKEEKNKLSYYFEDQFYVVVGSKDNVIDKVYLYTNKDTEYDHYLFNMIESVDSSLSKKEITDIVNKMTNVESKKADELGFLVNFKLNGYNYITMEKEQGKVISFFVYQLNQ